MEQKERSVVVTAVLCVVLVAGNYFVYTQTLGVLNLFAMWPVLFILCVVIAARIWHGHNSL
jgi:hypothetical protein